MILAEKGKHNDPNYAHLHMLSFAYNPSDIGPQVPFTYGVIAEYNDDPFSSERKFLTCYDTGFTALYGTQNGGIINGHIRLQYSEIAQLPWFEQFIGAQSEMPAKSEMCGDHMLASRSKQLVTMAAEYLKHTKETIDIKDHQEVQFWLLTSSGIFSGGSPFFEIMNKTSVWTDLFNEVQSIVKDCQLVGPDKGSLSIAAGF